jgi:peptide/nickel transport system permease protein
MLRYITGRLLGAIPVLFGITLIVFLFLHLTPGDPATVMLGARATPAQVEALREHMGLNKPLFSQYLLFLGGLLRLDFGNSIMTGIPIATEIGSRWTASFELATTAMLMAVAIGVPVGILAAVKKDQWVDNLAMISSLIGVSMPVYWLGLLMIYLFSVNLGWLPPSGRLGVAEGFSFKPLTGFYVLDAILQLNGAALVDILSHLVLPAIALSTIPLAIIARLTRSAMLEVMSQNYIRTARAKGVLERWVILKHSLKNALLPVITIIGLQFGALLTSAILTETIFSWPGVGSWIYGAILARDYPVVQGGIVFVAVTFVVINLLVDISYAFFDPRIQYK